MAKFDLTVDPDDQWLLGMVLGEELYVDTTLPFGSAQMLLLQSV